MKKKTHTLALKIQTLRESSPEKRLLFVLGVALFVLIGMYVYFVNTTVSHVVLRQKLEQEIQIRGTQVAELEREHMTLSESITRNYAQELGFMELTKISYITPESLAFAGANSDIQ